MKHIYGILLVAAMAVISSCSKEDDIDVENNKFDITDNFLPAASDTTLLANTRRDFFSQTGSYLLFNDTLQHIYKGKDFNGDDYYFTETVDLSYSIGSSAVASTKYTFNYINANDKAIKAVDYLKEYVIPHLTKQIKPFSWLLVDKITYKDTNMGTTSYPYCVSGQRCIAVACYPLWTIKESQLPAYTQQILSVLIAKIVTDNYNKFGEFLAVSEEYYGLTFADEFEISNEDNTTMLRNAGFIAKGKGSTNADAKGIYPTTSVDLTSYSRLALSRTRESVVEAYAGYPLVLQKDSLMRSTLENIGFVINID